MEWLYPKLLGDAWQALHPAVQRLHLNEDEELAAAGIFSIRHGRNLAARCVAWLLRMPKASDNAAVSLKIMKKASGEEWLRTIDGMAFPSRQMAGISGMLTEKVGILSFYFHLKTQKACLIYEQETCRLVLFGISLTLPRWMTPKVIASESPTHEATRCRIKVAIHFPLLGTLLEYSGVIQRTRS